jgi:hypothetical protein
VEIAEHFLIAPPSEQVHCDRVNVGTKQRHGPGCSEGVDTSRYVPPVVLEDGGDGVWRDGDELDAVEVCGE